MTWRVAWGDELSEFRDRTAEIAWRALLDNVLDEVGAPDSTPAQQISRVQACRYDVREVFPRYSVIGRGIEFYGGRVLLERSLDHFWNVYGERVLATTNQLGELSPRNWFLVSNQHDMSAVSLDAMARAIKVSRSLAPVPELHLYDMRYDPDLMVIRVLVRLVPNAKFPAPRTWKPGSASNPR